MYKAIRDCSEAGLSKGFLVCVASTVRISEKIELESCGSIDCLKIKKKVNLAARGDRHIKNSSVNCIHVVREEDQDSKNFDVIMHAC